MLQAVSWLSFADSLGFPRGDGDRLGLDGSSFLLSALYAILNTELGNHDHTEPNAIAGVG
jgi:hypothetical protein